MRRLTTHAAVQLCLGLSAGALAGCSFHREAAKPEASQSDERLHLSMRTDTALQLADLVDEWTSAHPEIPQSEKAAILARAAILRVNAHRVRQQLTEFRPADGSEATQAQVREYQARATELKEEFLALVRELGVWQVQHGLKKPDEIWVAYDREPMGERERLVRP